MKRLCKQLVLTKWRKTIAQSSCSSELHTRSGPQYTFSKAVSKCLTLAPNPDSYIGTGQITNDSAKKAANSFIETTTGFLTWAPAIGKNYVCSMLLHMRLFIQLALYMLSS